MDYGYLFIHHIDISPPLPTLSGIPFSEQLVQRRMGRSQRVDTIRRPTIDDPNPLAITIDSNGVQDQAEIEMVETREDLSTSSEESTEISEE